ncbi:ABC transporter ATP-binding protein [Thioalkalivibrio sp. ALMg9]|uniref:ABC transporter ATP-binding protein n=1 Tax=Thioalkalivibrio sp. ALMg9 TaxID=1266912 RepID=UPI00047600C7|nr:ATP-binding cassette domain-containing protein [Thioalkalivibrio sp. ALMg9]
MTGVAATNPDNAQGEVVIRVRGLTMGFDDLVLMRNLNFEVRRGEIFVILGGSGSGKSTLLQHMIGLYRPQAGHIWVAGADITEAEGAQREAILRRVGVMYQMGALFGSMTLLENARLPLEVHTDLPREAMDAVARARLQLVGLGAFADFMPSEISGGMQKRAAIARAMVLDPEVLFLDEPSAGLDPITSADLDRLIQRLARTLGMTIVIVSHELASIFAIADRVIMLDKESQGIAAEGEPATLRDTSDHPWVQRFLRRTDSDQERSA